MLKKFFNIVGVLVELDNILHVGKKLSKLIASHESLVHLDLSSGCFLNEIYFLNFSESKFS